MSISSQAENDQNPSQQARDAAALSRKVMRMENLFREQLEEADAFVGASCEGQKLALRLALFHKKPMLNLTVDQRNGRQEPIFRTQQPVASYQKIVVINSLDEDYNERVASMITTEGGKIRIAISETPTLEL